METPILILKIVFGVFFCFAGIMHIVKPRIFKNFIPDFLPKRLVNYIVGIIEFLLGSGLFFSETAKYAAYGIFILLIIFLPIHIWDVTRIRPAIGSKKIAILRVPLQFLLMYCAYLIYTNS
ncbi:DoxX family membrane protein [Polaribacter haliotis]|uniref:DoxX family membrane protein n=1 Tax=Polaribacter haliotis TaxID=1888915 RepID=A0A7L8AEM7_9FLAO|nr:MauE/DoxX family redox-associated membrane protein [Polaribacter haliotis]QOD60463.1 DoxX family membrane protein [Polaribacter haliotis]